MGEDLKQLHLQFYTHFRDHIQEHINSQQEPHLELTPIPTGGTERYVSKRRGVFAIVYRLIQSSYPSSDKIILDSKTIETSMANLFHQMQPRVWKIINKE